MQPLNDDELSKILARWPAPLTPASLEAPLKSAQEAKRLPAQGRRWWHWMLWGQIRVPVPLGALTLAALAVLAALAFRTPAVEAPDGESGFSDFQVVEDLNPRIIRSSYENN